MKFGLPQILVTFSVLFIYYDVRKILKFICYFNLNYIYILYTYILFYYLYIYCVIYTIYNNIYMYNVHSSFLSLGAFFM